MNSMNVKHWPVSLLLFLWMTTPLIGQSTLAPEIVDVKKIWDQAPHNAFTDLVRWRDHFYCAFREGQRHAGDIGKLRIIRSTNGDDWESVGLLSMDDYDLRDAALSITPDGRMMVLGGAQKHFDGKRKTGTFVSYSTDGDTYTKPQMVIRPGRWLWRVTWIGDVAYGVSYGANENPGFSTLLKTTDGVNYEVVVQQLLNEGDRPTEARIRFAEDGTAYCLHRRDGSANTAYMGTAASPYTQWEWRDLGTRLGGPNFLQLPDGHWIAAGRLYDGGARTELIYLDVEEARMEPLLKLPSGGDTSYPGLVWHDDLLWVSYYSSHEGTTNIYLAKVRFP